MQTLMSPWAIVFTRCMIEAEAHISSIKRRHVVAAHHPWITASFPAATAFFLSSAIAVLLFALLLACERATSPLTEVYTEASSWSSCNQTSRLSVTSLITELQGRSVSKTDK